MSDESKFFFFRPSIKPVFSSNGDGRRLHLISTADTAPGCAQKANLKRAFFFSGVAMLLILSSQLGHVKENSDSHSSAPSIAGIAGVKLTLRPKRHSEGQVGLAVPFRLSNMGNHLVYYPVRRGTNVPVGQIVFRDPSFSVWTSTPDSSKQMLPTIPKVTDSSSAWIEMPPGGWVDGEFHDPSQPKGEHAYAIYLKPEPNATAIRIVSEMYQFLPN